VYTVVFEGSEIWGEGADPTLRVSIDAWESYLEPA
ncbi:nitrile hydratase subunit beta, partial [Mesorhizobium sp. M7A.F.Ca.CA.002.15.1.1]